MSPRRFQQLRSSGEVGALACALAAFALAGCHHDEPPPPEKINLSTTQHIVEQPYNTSARPIIIQQGTLPLAWLCQADADVSFTDLDTHEALGDARVSSRQIVRLDARRGIAAGDETIRVGPLPESHHYAITLLPDRQNVMQTITGNSPVPPKPVSP